MGPTRSFLRICTFPALVLACLAVFSEGGDSKPEKTKSTRLTASQILERMAEVYVHCNSYRDTGLVRTVFLYERGSRLEEKMFRTEFVRPNLFRFEYGESETTGPKNRYIVWSKGKNVLTWWDVRPGVKRKESLNLALAGATGVSSGSAHTIPALLIPDEVSGRRLTDMTELERLKDADHGTVSCFRIRGKYAHIPRTIWIDRNTFLVRMIEDQRRFDGFRTENTTTYQPVIDSEIPKHDLEFDPPTKDEEIDGEGKI